MDRFLTLCTRVGIRIADGSLYLPDGLDDAWNGILRINPLNAQPDRFAQKCAEYQGRWPGLRVVGANDSATGTGQLVRPVMAHSPNRPRQAIRSLREHSCSRRDP